VRDLERGARLDHSGGPYYCRASKRTKTLNRNSMTSLTQHCQQLGFLVKLLADVLDLD
jgi:hypothetical protein